jgi:hypothetical protein
MSIRPGLYLVVTATVLLAGDQPGLIPRAPADYAAHVSDGGATIAASVVPPDQLRKIFSKDLNHAGYLVVELAVFPDAGVSADVTSAEFTMRAGSDPAILTAQTPASIARGDKPTVAKSKPPQLPGNVHVYNTETIGYESGGYGRRGGVYTESGVGVGVGNPGSGVPQGGCDPRYDPRYGCQPMPAPPNGKAPKDNAAFRQELEEKALPEGKTSQPVAGYLYFPKPTSKQKDANYQLSWYRIAGQVRLSLPAPK